MKAYSVFTVKSAGDDGLITGIATTPTPDRMGDIVEAAGAVFNLPLPLLWQHDAKNPIGNVVRATVTRAGIEIVAQIAKGVTAEIDKAWALIRGGLVRGLSIGFQGIDAEPLRGGGVRYTRWSWLELSAVTIPANAEATITNIKAAAVGGRRPVKLIKAPPMDEAEFGRALAIEVKNMIAPLRNRIEELEARLRRKE